MTLRTRQLLLGSLLALLIVALTVLCFGIQKVSANPSGFTPTASSAAATSTLVYQTAGTATTTLVFDSYTLLGTNQASAGITQAVDSVALLEQFTGSSTASTLNADIQYSQDGKDWYAFAFGSNFTVNAASTSPSVAAVTTVSFPFASSTIDRLTSAAVVATSSTRIVILPIPTRFVRAVFYMPVGSLNGAYFAQFVAKRQNQ